jgi:hypothetical protein
MYSESGGNGYKTCDRPHGSLDPARASIHVQDPPRVSHAGRQIRRHAVSAIGAVGTSGAGHSIPGAQQGGSRTALDGEIGQCQRQLADLVTCPSSKTPQGKAAMQALSDRISAARAAINNAPTRASQAGGAPPPQGASIVDTWA